MARGALRAVKLERERMPARVRALYDYDAEIDRAERVYDAALALLVTLDPAGDYAEFGLA